MEVIVQPSELVEGESANLTCRSDANPPPKTYMWYQRTDNETFQVGRSQTYSIASISLGQKEYYFCEAENDIGQNRSSMVQIYVPRE